MAIRQTYRSFVDTLEAVAVTGVVHTFDRGPPASLADAQLPAMWLQEIGGTEGALAFGELGGQQTLRATIVIAVKPTVQNTQGANFDNTIDMMDNLMAALMAMGLCDLKSRWTINIRETVIPVAEVEYWAVVCTVEG
jgi:hypothetical protein